MHLDATNLGFAAQGLVEASGFGDAGLCVI